MKTKISNSNLHLIAAAAAVTCLVGCAEMEGSTTKSLLSEAGFRVRTPQTAKQKEIYASLPANKIERAKVHGKVFYVFKDRKAGVAYVGDEAAHRRYQQLVAQKHTTQAPEEEMNHSLAVSWNNQWGPHGF
jgi:hypothetical protein